MTFLKAVILGLVQGATEFLPVSSSGHLVIMQYYLRAPQVGLAFDVLLHLATVAAVIVYFWSDLIALLHKPRQIVMLIIGSIPAAVAGVVLKKLFEKLFVESVSAVAVELIISGLILWAAEELAKKVKGKKSYERISPLDALLVGVGQAVAIVPGISRSGSTIATALALGIEREDAARFSFLLSIPVILGAGILEVKDIAATGLGLSTSMLAGGFIAAFIAGLLAISMLLSILKKRSLKIFSYYLWIIGAVILITQAL